ncbi:hypothetical protein GGQ84_002481 [Desulfitispora alkaliphila]
MPTKVKAGRRGRRRRLRYWSLSDFLNNLKGTQTTAYKRELAISTIEKPAKPKRSQYCQGIRERFTYPPYLL